MNVALRMSTAADRPAILALLGQARGRGLADAERAERGFVQGTIDEQLLIRCEDSTGIFVAEVDGALAGVAMTSVPELAPPGPPRLTVEAVQATDTTERDYFLYGPVAVAAEFQGRGLVRRLLGVVATRLRGRYTHGLLFVEEANRKSLTVHRHLGMDEAAGFVFRGRPYRVFTFPVTRFVTA